MIGPEQGRYVLRLMPRQIEKIRSEFETLGSIRELLSRRITLANLGSYIQNRVTGYLSAYEVCTNIEENVVHGSDSKETAEFEINYFFNELEIA